jgi:hypothetical protein
MLSVQSTAHQTIHLGLCIILILRALALLSNCMYIATRAVVCTHKSNFTNEFNPMIQFSPLMTLKKAFIFIENIWQFHIKLNGQPTIM